MKNLESEVPSSEQRFSQVRQLVETEWFGNTKVDHYFPTIDGQKVHYTESGDSGSRIIILGGIPFYAWEGFVGFIRPFSKNHIVNVFEYSGFGESQPLKNQPHNFETVAEILHQTIKQENLGPAHIVGLSFGGGVALHLASKYPEDVKSLSLQGVPVEFPIKTRKRESILKTPEIANLLERFFGQKYLWLGFFAFLISDPEPAKKLDGLKWTQRLAKKYAKNTNPKALREYFQSILGTSEEDWERLCQQITAPSLIIAASQEEWASGRGVHGTASKLAKFITDAKKTINPDTTTRFWHAKGGSFAQVSLPFIEEIDRES